LNNSLSTVKRSVGCKPPRPTCAIASSFVDVDLEPLQRLFPMGHGPYNVTNSHGSWAMQRCTTRCTTHGGWEISFPRVMGCTTCAWGLLPMHDGLYNSISTPCIMHCTTIYLPHGPCIVQQCIHPMPHELYNSS
jgi:hypothetical protein